MPVTVPDNSELDEFGRLSADFPWLALRMLHLSLRNQDASKGADFLKRYLKGFQAIWEAIHDQNQALKSIADYQTTDASALEHIAPGVGYAGRFASVIEGMGEAELRKAIGLAFPLWKARYLDAGLEATLRLFNGAAPAQIQDFFELRTLMDEETFDFADVEDDGILVNHGNVISVSGAGSVQTTPLASPGLFVDSTTDLKLMGVKPGAVLQIRDKIKTLDNGRYQVNKLVDNNTMLLDRRPPSNGANALEYYVLTEKNWEAIEIAVTLNQLTDRDKIKRLVELSRQVGQRMEIRYYDLTENLESEPTRLVTLAEVGGLATYDADVPALVFNFDGTADAQAFAHMLFDTDVDGDVDVTKLQIANDISIRVQFNLDATPPDADPYGTIVGLRAVDYEQFWETTTPNFAANGYSAQLRKFESGGAGTFSHGAWSTVIKYQPSVGAEIVLDTDHISVEIQENADNNLQMDVLQRPGDSTTLIRLLLNGNLVAEFEDTFRGAVAYGPLFEVQAGLNVISTTQLKRFWAWGNPIAFDIVEASTTPEILAATLPNYPLHGTTYLDDFTAYSQGEIIGQGEFASGSATSKPPLIGVGDILAFSDGGRNITSDESVEVVFPYRGKPPTAVSEFRVGFTIPVGFSLADFRIELGLYDSAISPHDGADGLINVAMEYSAATWRLHIYGDMISTPVVTSPWATDPADGVERSIQIRFSGINSVLGVLDAPLKGTGWQPIVQSPKLGQFNAARIKVTSGDPIWPSTDIINLNSIQLL